MDFLVSKLSTSGEWEKLARRFFGLWGERGLATSAKASLRLSLSTVSIHMVSSLPMV